MKSFKNFLIEVKHTPDLNDPNTPIEEVSAHMDLFSVTHPDISGEDSPFVQGLLHPHHSPEQFSEYITLALSHAHKKDFQDKEEDPRKELNISRISRLARTNPNPKLSSIAKQLGSEYSQKLLKDRFDRNVNPLMQKMRERGQI